MICNSNEMRKKISNYDATLAVLLVIDQLKTQITIIHTIPYKERNVQDAY